jgi:hypothetical protein
MKALPSIGLGALALVLGAGVAAAQIHVDLAFDTTHAGPGDTVTLSGSVTNAHALAVFAYLQVSLTLNGQPFGSVSGRLPLESGESVHASMSFSVPSLISSGIVEVSLVGTACDHSDTATATLTIVRGATVTDARALRTIGQDLIAAFGAEELAVGVEPTDWSRIKALFR